MNYKDDKVMLSMYDGDRLAERSGTDDYAYLEDGTADLATGLTSLGFITATLRRTARLWCTLAVAGMVIGLGVFVKLPPSYKATTSLLLTPESIPGEPAGTPIVNEENVADSHTVAELAMKTLGVRQSVDSFVKSYTVTDVTDRIILITVSARTASRAVSEANALATQFLRFRANAAEAALTLMDTSLQQQIAQDQQNAKSITTQISQLSAEHPSPAQQAELKKLKAEPAAVTLGALEAASAADEASTRITIEKAVQGSQVLDPASLSARTQLRRLIEFVGIGLLAGLVLGIGIVLVRELSSDRLRRRDDIARALGAPVKLSVGPVRLSRWRPDQRGLAVARRASVQRIVSYLADAVPPSRRGPETLAVVPADDVRVPAICLVSLALSYAGKGLKVVVADLCAAAPAARLLGDASPGVRTVSVQGTHLTVAVPEGDTAVATGPLQRTPGPAPAAEPVITACASADLLLTLAPLDPSLGGDHLAGWTGSAVAMVTGGRSSAARIHAVGEMIRLAGITLISGVLVGTDKTDESLGAAPAPGADRDALTDDMRDEMPVFLLPADRVPGEG